MFVSIQHSPIGHTEGRVTKTDSRRMNVEKRRVASTVVLTYARSMRIAQGRDKEGKDDT